MSQTIMRRGKVVGETVPLPSVSEGSALIKVLYSCISAGTEITTVLASKTSLIKRAIEQPEHVKKVFDMVRSVGIARTFEKIKGSFETGSVLAYSRSGVVLAIGNGVRDLRIGDRVAC